MNFHHGRFPKYVLFLIRTRISQNNSERYYARKLYLLSGANNYCGRVTQRHGFILNKITTPRFFCENLLKSGSV